MLRKGNYIFIVVVLVIISAVWFNSYNPDNRFGISQNHSQLKVSLVSSAGLTKSLSKEQVPEYFSINASDSGKIYTFPLHTKFSLTLPFQNNPQNYLISLPTDILKKVSTKNLSSQAYQIIFETVLKGTCVLADKNFNVTVQVK